MKKFKICSFFGHRELFCADDIRKKLVQILKNLIKNEDYGIFLFGGFGDFDELCHKIITELKKEFLFIKRIYCLEDEKCLQERKRPKYLTKDDYEEFIYLTPSFSYWYTRIYYRNIAMIDTSDLIIFYAENKENSGAYKALKYAIKTKKKFLNIIDN